MGKKDRKDYRNRLQNLEQSVAEQQEKAILWFSGAGLAFSVTATAAFRNPLVCLWLIKASWVAFCAAIVATLLSFWATNRSVKKQIRAADAASKQGKLPGDPDNRLRIWLNWISLAAVIFGIISAVIFLSLQTFGGMP